MAEKAYPRPEVALSELLNVLVDAGVPLTAVQTREPAMVKISITALSGRDLDEIWSQAVETLVSKLRINPALIEFKNVNEDLEKVYYQGREIFGLRYKHDRFTRAEWVRASEAARIWRSAGLEPDAGDYWPYA